MLVWTLDSCRLTQPNFYEPTVLSALFFQRILFPDASQRKASPVGQVFVRNSRAQDMFYSWTTTAASGIQDTWDERGKACVSHHFLCVCMCISSDGCRLRSAWATDFYPFAAWFQPARNHNKSASASQKPGSERVKICCPG